MRSLAFYSQAFDEFIEWQTEDKKLFKRLIRLLKEIRRTPFEGIGKPEPLKHEYVGYWSRRIDQKHRIIYSVTDEQIFILSCKGHYD